jgi:hypothetical protein
MGFTRDVKCGVCEYEGKIEAHDTVKLVPESDIFKLLGKDSSTGFIHVSCPSCNADLAIDPLKIIGAKQIVGYPETTLRSNRFVSFVWGILCVIVAVFILAKFSGWWTYIVVGILAILAIGFFYPGKETKT